MTPPNRNCDGCRFWSMLLAHANGDGAVEALCLSKDGPFSGTYTSERQTCDSWRDDALGAVDNPVATPDYGSNES